MTPVRIAPNREVLRFETTAKASADAHALGRNRVRFDVVIDLLALVISIVLIASGNVALGIGLIVIAGLSLVEMRFHPLLQAVTSVRFRSLLGQTTEVTIEDDGLRFENPLATSFIPWTSITAVRSNSQTIAFYRDSALMGYIPANAFESPEAQARVAVFARSRIGNAAGRPVD